MELGDGTSLGDTGGGESGGLSNAASGHSEAPGLNVKLGSAGDLLGRSKASPKGEDRSLISIAESGLLPVAFEKDDGAEAEEGLAGKTKGGFGRGGIVRGDA